MGAEGNFKSLELLSFGSSLSNLTGTLTPLIYDSTIIPL
jgi:hypothetical protein